LSSRNDFSNYEPRQATVKVPKFTPAEQRVVRLITLGLSTKEVARVLGKAVSTVDNQRTSAMRAAEINTATLLVRVALKAGITTLEDDLSPSERRRLRLATHRGKRKGTRRRAADNGAHSDADFGADNERPRKASKGKKSPPGASKVARRGKKGAAAKRAPVSAPTKKKRRRAAAAD
jgi:DNA-binding CsgD family transcriptional regulator